MSSLSDNIIADLRRTQAQRELSDKMGLLSKVKHLQDWQCKRLLRTHETLANQPEYKKAMAFFVDELYGPKDFSQRDADIVRVVPKLAALLPEKAMRALAEAISLNALSFDLDLDLIHHLKDELNNQSYALAYREMGRLPDRQKQIDIIAQLGQRLAGVVHIRGVNMLIKFARKPAKVANLLSLHEFLERGFEAFKDIGDVDAFIDPIIDTEQKLMFALHNPQVDIEKHNPIDTVVK